MLRKVVAAALQIGVIDTFLYGLGRMLSRLGIDVEIHRFELVAQPVVPQLVRDHRGRTFSVREIAPGNSALDAMPLTKETIDFRFAQESVCLGVFKGENLVGYLWLRFGAYEEDMVRCRFVPNPVGEVAWDYDVYIVPKYRVGLAFACLWDGANTYLRGRGIAWTFSRISAFNPGSMRAHRRLAAERVGRALFICRRRFQVMIATAPPYVHFSRIERRRPVVNLYPPKLRAISRRRIIRTRLVGRLWRILTSK